MPKSYCAVKLPVDPATRFVLELDLEDMTEDELDYLHKLRTMAQRQTIEACRRNLG
jgi:hypothetical protein